MCVIKGEAPGLVVETSKHGDYRTSSCVSSPVSCLVDNTHSAPQAEEVLSKASILLPSFFFLALRVFAPSPFFFFTWNAQPTCTQLVKKIYIYVYIRGADVFIRRTIYSFSFSDVFIFLLFSNKRKQKLAVYNSRSVRTRRPRFCCLCQEAGQAKRMKWTRSFDFCARQWCDTFFKKERKEQKERDFLLFEGEKKLNNNNK